VRSKCSSSAGELDSKAASFIGRLHGGGLAGNYITVVKLHYYPEPGGYVRPRGTVTIRYLYR
jgi:hypothetical protein